LKKYILWLGFSSILFLSIIPALGIKISFFFYVMLWITMASSMNIILGYTGYLPFGYVAFFGIGSYVAAILATRVHLHMLLSILIAGASGPLLALIFFPTLKLKGIYFAIVNMSLAEALRVIIANAPEEFTGGSFGISLASQYDPILSYYTMLVVMTIAITVAWKVSNSKLGLALKCIKQDTIATEVLGIDTARFKLYAWLLSAFFPAITGGIEAWHTAVIDPNYSFNILITAKSILYPMFGGLGTFSGPLIGPVILYFLDDLIWGVFPLLNLIIIGVLMAFMNTMLPDGIIGTLNRKHPNFRRILR
jgi:branched-chain amino acid transport system permease protein